MSNIDKRALRERAESTIGILDNIAGFEPSDIDGDSLELRFETEGGFDTGCDVSIVDQCQKAADVVRALLDELEAAEKRIAELSSMQGKPIAWESTTPVYVKFITDERYQRLRPGYNKWYKPYRCSQCAAAGKGEAS